MAGSKLKEISMHILTINTGSTSLKLERYDLGQERLQIAAPQEPAFRQDAHIDDAEHAIIEGIGDDTTVVAHRLVHLPQSMPAVRRLDDDAIEQIEQVGADAPLHNATALQMVHLIKHLQPAVVQYAVSDSAFHATLSEPARTYAIPRALTRKGFQRIGYHGISHAYAAHRGCALAEIDIADARVVTAHLGGGSSLCAVRNGASIDTTMGFTPLEGVPMATRSGSVDPGLLLHLLRNGTSIDELSETLEQRSGLLGISDISGDVRELLASAPAQPSAQLALDVFAWRVRAAIGALIATIGGIDLLVFTGGIGEHAATLRAAILDGGLGLAISLDDDTNTAGHEGRISAPTSRSPVCIVQAREGWHMALMVMKERTDVEDIARI